MLCVIAFLAYRHHVGIVFLMVLLSWIALFVRHRNTQALSAWSRGTGVVVGGYCLSVVVFVWLYLPSNPAGIAFLIGTLLLIALNQQFYFFLAGQKGRLFALAAIPFHLLYFISSGLAFTLTLVRYRLGKLESPVVLPTDEAKANR
jgi:hypothetical protein